MQPNDDKLALRSHGSDTTMKGGIIGRQKKLLERTDEIRYGKMNNTETNLNEYRDRKISSFYSFSIEILKVDFDKVRLSSVFESLVTGTANFYLKLVNGKADKKMSIALDGTLQSFSNTRNTVEMPCSLC